MGSLGARKYELDVVMNLLEKQFDVADKFLTNQSELNWQRFCEDLAKVSNFGCVLYIVNPKTDARHQTDELLGTSHIELFTAYAAENIAQFHLIPEDSLYVLSPTIRSELVDDANFQLHLKKHPAYGKFCTKWDFYYQMIVPTRLPSGRIVGLVSFRGKTEPDFIAKDGRRLALLTRHIVSHIERIDAVSETKQMIINAFREANQLTSTEAEILSYLARGQSLRQISTASSRGYGTIRWHVQNILSKTGNTSQKELIANFYAIISG